MSRSAPPPTADPTPPAPWRPKLTGELEPLPDRPAGSSGAADAYDALADLFLGDTPIVREVAKRQTSRDAEGLRIHDDLAPADAAPLPQSTEQLWVEGIILGHLPVTGMAWANQYARHVAEHRGGPVAVLKLIAGQGSLEIIGARPGAVAAPEPAAASLEEAIAFASAHCRTWLLRVDEPTEPKLLEPGLLDALTLLTGIDEAAMVASYRTAKTLMEPHHDEEGNPIGPEFGLALMGATDDRARPAAARITTAAEKFLGRKLTVSAVVPKIGPGLPALSLFRGALNDAEGGAEGTLDRLRRLFDACREEAAAQDPMAARPAESEAAASPGGSAVASPVPEPAELLSELSDPAPAPLETEPCAESQHPAPLLPRAVGAPESLARLLGLNPLRASCPFAPEVELAAGPDGTVHLLAAVADSLSGQEAVEQLLVASAWVPKHVQLLRLTGPEASGLDSAQPAVLHLFTERAASVQRLLDGEFRVHLLVRTTQDDQEHWVCADLN